MSKRYLGILASSEVVTVVEAEMPDAFDDPIIMIGDTSWKVQKGARAAAYATLHQQCVDHIRENKIDGVVIKASAIPQGSPKLGLLVSAEVRGVVMAAAASVCTNTSEITAASISRNYGNRKIGEYLADDEFWATVTTGGALRKTSREAAMLLVAQRKQ